LSIFHLILDTDAGWQGASHDARTWDNSNMKTVFEHQCLFLVTGDSRYPISNVLIKPSSNRVALVDRHKAEFNTRLSRIRKVSSKNIFGFVKRNKFPILKTLRAHYDHARSIFIEYVILLNISIRWRQEEIVICQEPAEVFPFQRILIVEVVAAPNVVQEGSQIVRDQLKLGMDDRWK
jgi:hypothetical protein